MVAAQRRVRGHHRALLILLGEAEHAIYAGVEIARRQGNRGAVGDLLQRLAFVLADRGDHVEALRLAEEAAFIHLRNGDPIAFGMST